MIDTEILNINKNIQHEYILIYVVYPYLCLGWSILRYFTSN